jgi:U3 small nucleolar RNA-associated protein 19
LIYTNLSYRTFFTNSLKTDSYASQAVSNAIDLLLSLPPVNESTDAPQLFVVKPQNPKQNVYSASTLKKHVQRAWLSILSQQLTLSQRKLILGSLTTRIIPYFNRPETLMDFLTDSYNFGSSISLLALSGLFALIQEKNLDYPSFYPKLYSLLDSDILHSKYRSRFFRYLNIFLSSTHLPAALVASFIKRLSRLALHAPPAGIVVTIPWVYNMLQLHPACTFMLHRETQSLSSVSSIEENSLVDTYDPDENDPMETGAIDSCLWELLSLQSHYHPNIATLAKIISEQFTKPRYEIEDFLDYSYKDLIETELSREIKKTPVVEGVIPKNILTESEGGLNEMGMLLRKCLKSDDVEDTS